MSKPDPSDTAVLATASPARADPVETAERVTAEQPGRYLVRGEQGRGGMGRVLIAFDEHVGREVAMKELLGDAGALADGGAQVRFVREARVTGQLEHPNIVPVHELGRSSTGRLYYTMRLVHGRTLAQVLQESRSVEERLKQLGSFWDACNAIAYAHSHGVIHRDIKPLNIMVGEFGETVVLDWGLAKVSGQHDLRAEELQRRNASLAGAAESRAGQAIGTPAYMSPEQARGDVSAIDERSDVWGLGALLYEILTGQPPFLAPSAEAVLERVASEPVRPVAQACPEAPPELAAIAERALRRDPAQRYPKAKDLADDVEAYMTGGRVRAYRYDPWDLFKRFAAEHKAALLAAATTLVVIVAALVAVSFALQRESAALAQETAARADEKQERLKANLHLAQAYAFEAVRRGADRRLHSAAVFAAASLQHNPAHVASPVFDEAFARRHPAGNEARAIAGAQVQAAKLDAVLRLERTFAVSEPVRRVALSPDGTMLAASVGGQVLRWRLPEGAPLPALDLGGNRGWALAFSPDGKRLASTGRDALVRLWDPASGQLLAEWSGHASMPSLLEFSPDGEWVATAGIDKTVRIWEVATGKCRAVLEQPDGIGGLAFSPDGSAIAAGPSEAVVRVWRLADLSAPPREYAHETALTTLAYSPDSRLLVAAAGGGVLVAWDVATGKRLASLKGHSDRVQSLVFIGPRELVSTGYDRTVRLWDAPTGELLQTLDAHSDFIYSVAGSATGLVATGSFDKLIHLWRREPRSGAGARLRGHRELVASLAVSADGRFAASGSWDKTARFWDLAGRRELRHVPHEGSVDAGVAFTPDGRTVVSATSGGWLRRIELETGAIQWEKRLSDKPLHGLSLSPDAKTISVGAVDGVLRLVRLEDGAVERTFPVGDVVDGTAFSPDGSLVAGASYDKHVYLWRLSDGAPTRLAGHSDWASGLAFSPSGQLVSAGKDGQAILWDVGSGREVRRFVGHTQWVNVAEFSPDGALLATGSDDSTVRLWSVADGRLLLRFDLPQSGGIVVLRFTPDGRNLLYGDRADVRIHPMDLSVLNADAGELLQRAEKAHGLRLDGFELHAR